MNTGVDSDQGAPVSRWSLREKWSLAKNKLRGQKSKNVFHIANQKNFKAKNKAKPVTTNLELIPQQCHESKPVNVGEATKLMAQL
uniref:uncharacterized protein C8orf59 homolog n=1 Tax=Macaca mulatta TaxID=9544 RepID=UPI0010A286D4|nr:uncharacterized protein C8orf59 homolog [Macaca mulatta]